MELDLSRGSGRGRRPRARAPGGSSKRRRLASSADPAQPQQIRMSVGNAMAMETLLGGIKSKMDAIEVAQSASTVSQASKYENLLLDQLKKKEDEQKQSRERAQELEDKKEARAFFLQAAALSGMDPSSHQALLKSLVPTLIVRGPASASAASLPGHAALPAPK